MKNLVVLVLLTTCFASAALADSVFICGDSDLGAQLKISEPIIKNGSYNECNGGVGDEMTNCQTRSYQVSVQEVLITLKVNDDTLFSGVEVRASANKLNGFDMLVYKDNAIHLTLAGNKKSPLLSVKFMAKGTQGNPVEIGDYLLSCK